MTDPETYPPTCYEIHAYASDGAELRLTPPDDSTWFITADNVFSAVAALAVVPSQALLEWDDGDHEMCRVARIELIHSEKRISARGRVTYSTNMLETITR